MKNSNAIARFASVIEQSGKPKFVSLWGKPDAVFLSAVSQNRVMTITIHPVGNKAEFGTVGFQKEKNVLYLLFPKPLDDVKGKRIVGVKLELVEEEGITGKSKPTRTARKETQKTILSPERFTVVIRSTVIVDTSYDIEARNKKTAGAKAQEAAGRESLDLEKAKTEHRILRITPSSRSPHQGRRRKIHGLALN